MDSSRNIYKNGIDFTTLALQSPEFAKHLKSKNQLDFSNPKSVQQLAKSLLQRDFGLSLELPPDRLCPPVPNRLNYILWLQDLLDSSSDEYGDDFDDERDVIGLDVGTGASCIYPLLGCQQRPRWRFGATDVDEMNIEYARDNVARNELKSRIRVVKTTPDDPLIQLKAIGAENIDFVMCNPPFYVSREEMLESAKEKSRPPFSACTGADVEMVTPGGEVAFVNRIIAESVKLRDQVQWYSSMVGKSQSIPALVQSIKDAGITNWAVTQFVQGNKTRRWALAWSWGDLRPRMDLSRGIPGFPKNVLPFPSEYRFTILEGSIDQGAKDVTTCLDALDEFQWKWNQNMLTGHGFAMRNVWSRQARRRKKRGRLEEEPDEQEEIDEDEAALGIRVLLRQSKQEKSAEIVIRWLKGNDEVLFESFCGMLHRKLEKR